MLYRQYYLSPIGRLCLVASDQALYGVWLEGQKHFQAGIKEEELVDTSNPILKMTKELVKRLILKVIIQVQNTLPLADRGTTFQLKVWSALRDIPVGESRTYSQIGKVIYVNRHRPLGTAVGKNPWLILVPCHRVLPSSGHIGKYAAGEDAKRFLLHLEGIRFDNP